MQELSVIGNLFKTRNDCLSELLGFFDQNFLNREKIPVLSNRLQQIIEEVVKLYPQVVPDENDVVA